MNNPVKLREALSGFYGSEQFYRHGLVRKLIYTEGVQHFAEHAGGGAYWFLDIVATEVLPYQRKQEFIAIVMTVADGKADIVAHDGNYNDFWKRHIGYTDCPDGEWSFYLCNNTLMLPSEY